MLVRCGIHLIKYWFSVSDAKDEMFAVTDIKQAPWYVVNAEDKETARLNVIRHLLSLVSYQDMTPEPLKLPALDKTKYIRPPFEEQNFITQIYRPKRSLQTRTCFFDMA